MSLQIIFTETCKLIALRALLIVASLQAFCINCVAVNGKEWQISLLTCSPGDELYSAYGHSAVRLRNLYIGADAVFNYGTFDFNTPFFYLKFLNGQLDYKLSVSSFDNFLRNYKDDGREVVEREFILSTKQCEDIARLLIENAEPQNAYYRYDFFFDNCATRIRDIVFKINNEPKLSSFEEKTSDTFRDCIHSFVGPNDWCGQGIDIILGIRTDYLVSKSDKAMLPNYLEALFVESGIVGEPKVLVSRESAMKRNDSISLNSPVSVSIALVVIVLCLSIIEISRKIEFSFINIILFSIMSVIGLLLWYLWLVSEIKITTYNINVLWASVLYIPMLFLRAKGRVRSSSCAALAYINLAMIVLFFVLCSFGVQFLSPLAVSCSIVLFIRNCLIVWHK